ncbi:MAG: outer membrane lipoprotein carrier protein LolA [Deltaproteobacteria bacterium]|nr:outer membrane lipoprotein carrier protein LolA [Deltaproteobacteria bacterium]
MRSGGWLTRVGILVCAALLLGALPAQAKGKKGKAKAKSAAATAPAKPAKTEPAKTEPAKVEPAQGEPAKPAVAAAVTAQQVADGIQKFYDAQPGFHAAFTQVVTKKGLATGLKREGMAWLKRGDAAKNQQGKMRWDYPTEEIFYFCNGETLWSYERRERLAVKVPVKNSQVYQATQYLVGQGNLSKDFQLELVTSPLADTYALRLTPKSSTAMRSLTLMVDKATFAVKASQLVDPIGDTTDLVWRDVKYVGADDKVFEWQPPAGVTIKELGRAGQ